MSDRCRNHKPAFRHATRSDGVGVILTFCSRCAMPMGKDYPPRLSGVIGKPVGLPIAQLARIYGRRG